MKHPPILSEVRQYWLSFLRGTGPSKFSDCFLSPHGGGRNSHRPGSCDSLVWCFSCWKSQAVWSSLWRENDLQQRWDPPDPRGQHRFPPQDLAHPTQHGERHQNTRSPGWLELKSPFACLEQGNLSDTSCCEPVLLGAHLLLCYSLPEECGMLQKGKWLQSRLRK